MIKTIALLTVLTITPVNPKEPAPVETVTITKDLAEKLVQSNLSQQIDIAHLKQELYQLQMLLYEARTRMCA